MRFLAALVVVAACAGPKAAPPVKPSPPPPPVAAAPSPPEDYVEMTVAAVYADDAGAGGAHLVLMTLDANRALPLGVDVVVAANIQFLMNRTHHRPLTHDLFHAFLDELGAKVLWVQIDRFERDSAIATLYIETKDGVVTVDARASDAAAIAVARKRKIWVAPAVIEEGGFRRPTEP